MAMLVLIGIFVSSIVGCFYLALSQSRNVLRSGGEARQEKMRRNRLIGWALLGVALLLCILRDGWSFSILLWPLSLMMSVFVVAVLLTYKPRWLRRLTN